MQEECQIIFSRFPFADLSLLLSLSISSALCETFRNTDLQFRSDASATGAES